MHRKKSIKITTLTNTSSIMTCREQCCLSCRTQRQLYIAMVSTSRLGPRILLISWQLSTCNPKFNARPISSDQWKSLQNLLSLAAAPISQTSPWIIPLFLHAKCHRMILAEHLPLGAPDKISIALRSRHIYLLHLADMARSEPAHHNPHLAHYDRKLPHRLLRPIHLRRCHHLQRIFLAVTPQPISVTHKAGRQIHHRLDPANPLPNGHRHRREVLVP